MILIIDFGSQTCHLIARQLKKMGIETLIVNPNKSLEKIRKFKPQGIILSGGPASVLSNNSPTIDKEIFNLGIPILGICYGWQLTAKILGGTVVSGHKEYGPASLQIFKTNLLFNQISNQTQVWVSHGDTVTQLPADFNQSGQTQAVENAAVGNTKKNIYGVQFHPEVDHTSQGNQMLKNFANKICKLQLNKKEISVGKLINKIKTKVGQEKVVCAVSGGVDSTVTAALIGKAIGKNLIPIYVNSGLMRIGTKNQIKKIFSNLFNIKPIIIEAGDIFLNKLAGVTEPEKKRKIIGNLYIDLIEKKAKQIKGIKYLAQGTIYSDVIESKGSKNADKIKSHHNVGGLPEKLDLKLIEPLRNYYKDEVKQIGRKLGLPEKIINKQPFPGPGQAIRIIGEITKERLEKQHQADQIVLEEIKKAGLYNQIFQSFPIMTGVKSTAVKGDSRFYGEVVGLRIYQSSNIMTASWAKLPDELLQKMSSRIVNEVTGVSRVVYDITTKPPATMEWE